MKRNVNKEDKEVQVVRLFYNPQYKGLEKSKDVRAIDEVLRGYRCISNIEHAKVYVKGDLTEDGTIAEPRAYVHIFSLGQEYLVEMREYLAASDRLGNKHYSYSQSLVLFLERYAYRFMLFSVVVKEQKVI